MDLKGKSAIVTGARRGIGRGIALALAKAGANVAVSDIDKNECEKVVAEIERLGVKGIAIKADVSNSADVDAMVRQTVKKFGGIDIIVNNAGIYFSKPLLETTEKDWDRLIGINLKGVFLCTKAAVAEMVKQGRGGKVISISSIAGEVGFANSSAYCASKGGIINLTRELAIELAQHKINVNSIAPGVIETPMTAGMLDDAKTKAGLLASIPWGRIGKPEDIANAVVFLASPEADYITGATLAVDGGWISQ